MILKRLKDLVLKNYKNYLVSVFIKFKEGGQVESKKQKKKAVLSMEMSYETLQEEVKQVTTNNRQKAQAVSSMQQKKTTKHNKLLQKRYRKNAWLKWMELMTIERNKEAKAKFIIDRLRENYVRQAFESYKNQFLKQKYIEFKD